MALIIFHLQDPQGKPLGDVLADSVGGPGPWQAKSNPCGDIITDLDAGHYEITFSKSGYATLTLPADLGDCGIVTQALQPTGAPTPRPPLPFEPGVPGVLPPIPTRAQVCAVQHSLAGLTYHTTEFGDCPRGSTASSMRRTVQRRARVIARPVIPTSRFLSPKPIVSRARCGLQNSAKATTTPAMTGSASIARLRAKRLRRASSSTARWARTASASVLTRMTLWERPTGGAGA